MTTGLEPIIEFAKHIDSIGGHVYEVGGRVRDHFLKKQLGCELVSKDIDLVVCGVEPMTLIRVLNRFGRTGERVGHFPVFKWTPTNYEGVVDVALPRTETSTGPTKQDFHVSFDEHVPIEIDLQRRDFTMGAMARDVLTGRLVDPFGGQKDIETQTLRAVFRNTFREDPSRILRACQFAARFNLTVESVTLDEMEAAADRIRYVKGEPIAIELVKLCSPTKVAGGVMLHKPSVGFRLMHRANVLNKILPEVANLIGVAQPKKHHDYDAFDHVMAVTDAAAEFGFSPEVVFGGLFHDLGKAVTFSQDEEGNIHFFNHERESVRLFDRIIDRIPLSQAGIDVEKVRVLVAEHMFNPSAIKEDGDGKAVFGTNGKVIFQDMADATLRRLIRKVGRDRIVELCELKIADKMGGSRNAPHQMEPLYRLLARVKVMLEEKVALNVNDLALKGGDIMTELGLKPSKQIGDIQKALLEKVLTDPAMNERGKLLEEARRMAAV